jgi:multidrug efflux pump
MMTSIATMMAALPAALALGAGSETRSPMALAVIGGLLVSTLLSLVVVPAFYLVADRLLSAWQRWRKKGPGGAPGATPSATPSSTPGGAPAPLPGAASPAAEPQVAAMSGSSSAARAHGP